MERDRTIYSLKEQPKKNNVLLVCVRVWVSLSLSLSLSLSFYARAQMSIFHRYRLLAWLCVYRYMHTYTRLDWPLGCTKMILSIPYPTGAKTKTKTAP